ncbi:MAG TPA: putative peptidoglycan glycosyltransferase FtsW [Verrucomicrobiota bacterium]|nr:putative peptidoglycan glycosyltransferase FtsW [Verrucomicrobiota bacterium]HNU52754.1 putative peptidoglycan glycosyltransferase FtsW [Verrucomicrobiota bacterium]
MNRATTLLLFCVAALMSVGMVTLYSISPPDDSSRYLSRQVIAGGLGLAGASLLVAIGHQRLRSWTWIVFALAIILLACVLVFGVKINGARRWFRLAGFQFQPSDFAKFALLLALASYGAAHHRLTRTFRHGILVPGLIALPVVVLVFLEPDWGTALLLAAVSTGVLLVAGARWRYLLPPVLLGIAAVGGLLYLNPVRIDRIEAWLHPEATRLGVGYQAWQARLALGAGGPTGVGLNASTQKTFLPEHQTDFIFAIIGEEFGLAGSLGVVALFALFLACGLSIARHAADRFSQLLAAGITFLVSLQAMINIGVVSGAFPNKGLALPFVSYGGSNLMMMLLCTGALVSVARGTPQPDGAPAALEENHELQMV